MSRPPGGLIDRYQMLDPAPTLAFTRVTDLVEDNIPELTGPTSQEVISWFDFAET